MSEVKRPTDFPIPLPKWARITLAVSIYIAAFATFGHFLETEPLLTSTSTIVRARVESIETNARCKPEFEVTYTYKGRPYRSIVRDSMPNTSVGQQVDVYASDRDPTVVINGLHSFRSGFWIISLLTCSTFAFFGYLFFSLNYKRPRTKAQSEIPDMRDALGDPTPERNPEEKMNVTG